MRTLIRRADLLALPVIAGTLVLAGSCGASSVPKSSGQQNVAWSAPAGGHGKMIARDHHHARRSCPSQLDDILITHSGNHLRAGGNDAAGNPVVEKANNIGAGQPMCWHQTGTDNGNAVGYWQADDNGNRPGFGPNCTRGLNWLNTTDGTLFIWHSVSGGFRLQSKACQSGGGYLSSDNSAGDQWTRQDGGAGSFYQTLNLQVPGT